MKKFIIGSLLIGLSSISLFGYQQCNGSNSPCDLNGEIVGSSGNFVKYSGSNLKNYTKLYLVGSNKPYAYTVARRTDTEIVLNMSDNYKIININCVNKTEWTTSAERSDYADANTPSKATWSGRIAFAKHAHQYIRTSCSKTTSDISIPTLRLSK